MPSPLPPKSHASPRDPQTLPTLARRPVHSGILESSRLTEEEGSLKDVPQPVRHRRYHMEPPGALFQVEYAMEAVKQGSACVGLCSRTHAVLAAVNKPASELSYYQRKVFRIAEHAGVALAGLTVDGRVLSCFLRNECINHSFVYEASLPISRLALKLADKAQFSYWLALSPHGYTEGLRPPQV
ncbi:unnamed protein product [Miscanthus lutarioriparius]|uniref:Uncharacterized protein n=1 Tax=Miscanthus lutarioriparius TaxID=422564 RepID=A0A811P1F5_9POAL|nr:unnamed protein product [Miscanthus lutarioriparius]